MSKRKDDHGKAAVLGRGIDVLLVIKNTGVATSFEIQAQALPYLTIRSVQRYLKSFVDTGLIYSVGGNNEELRYFLTGKAKQLFGVK